MLFNTLKEYSESIVYQIITKHGVILDSEEIITRNMFNDNNDRDITIYFIRNK